MLIFVRLIFVATINYENIFTTKISRFTVILYEQLNMHIIQCMHSNGKKAIVQPI